MFELRVLRGVIFRKEEDGREGGRKEDGRKDRSVGLLWDLSSSAVSNTELFIELH